MHNRIQLILDPPLFSWGGRCIVRVKGRRISAHNGIQLILDPPFFSWGGRCIVQHAKYMSMYGTLGQIDPPVPSHMNLVRLTSLWRSVT